MAASEFLIIILDNPKLFILTKANPSIIDNSSFDDVSLSISIFDAPF